jgi:hypothetical protein
VSNSALMTKLRADLKNQTSAASAFKASVDRQMSKGDVYLFDPWYVALMGQITGTASYCTYAVAETDKVVASEEALIASGKNAAVSGDDYLKIGDEIGNLAMVYDWCRSSMTAAQRTRWVTFGNQAVFNVWNYKQATWGGRSAVWDNWSTSNPSNNYYYSFLRATMLLGLATYGENDYAGAWLTHFRTNKIKAELVPTFTTDLVGGGSREGTGYGVAMKDLWLLYDWWERSTGERIADLTPHTLASMPWMIHSIVPTLDRVIPTGDHSRDSTASLFDYHRDYLQKLVALYPNERISGVARSLLAQSSVKVMSQQFMQYSDYIYDMSAVQPVPLEALSTAYWGSGTGSFSMRSDWTKAASYANFICGPYTESHAHKDQGSFVLFNGNWLAYDANIDGHSGIEQDQPFHNTVRFETSAGASIGQTYNKTCNMVALANAPEWAYGMADITPMYAAGSGVTKSEREFVFIRPSTFIVYDRYTVSNSALRRIFTMNYPVAPSVLGSKTSVVNGDSRLDMTRIIPGEGAATPTSIFWNSVSSEYAKGSTASRQDLAVTGADTSEFLHVFGINGAVSAAVAASATGQSGVMVTLADGRVAIVRFNQASRGGTLQIKASSGATLVSINLPTTVTAPPIYAN